MATIINHSISGTVATVTFVSENGVNVLCSDVLKELGRKVGLLAGNPEIRTAIFRAEGKVFVAGADIKEMSSFNPDEAHGYGLLGQGVFDDIETMPCVTIAAIHGAALGGGLELALACDFRLAVRTAKLGLPEVTLGLIPGWGGISRLTELVGPSRAKRLYLSGTPISAEEGLAIGLVDDVVNSVEDLGGRVQAFAKQFAKGSPLAIRLAKRAAGFGDEVEQFAACFGESDAQEGIRAFVDKRPARWME